MRLVPPDFWFQRTPSIASRMLAPLEALWRGASARRQRRTTPIECGVPVLCIGNVTLGGAGKTPVALHMVTALKQDGIAVHVLSRGYGGRLSGPIAVDPDRHTAYDVGDEPLLLSRLAPTWVSADRVAGARAARSAGAMHIVMDDGFQNPKLAKSLSILVIDAEVGIGNGRVFPAGPLREPFDAAVARADAVVVLHSSKTTQPAPLPPMDPIPVLRADLIGRLPADLSPGKECFAFAGIGRPEKFFETARQSGLKVKKTKAFPDHHPFSRAEIDDMIQKAQSEDLALVTTAKDCVRLPPEYSKDVHVLDLDLHWHKGLSPYTLLRKEGENAA